MNKNRFDSIMSNTSALAKKVYAAVPIAEQWSKSQVHSEVRRQFPSSRDLRMTEGCLNSLKDQGVVVEPKPGFFIRAVVHTPTKKTKVTEMTIAPTELPPEPKSPIEALAAIADAARLLAKGVDEMATLIENAALEIDSQMEEQGKGYEKLKQFKTLLAELG